MGAIISAFGIAVSMDRVNWTISSRVRTYITNLNQTNIATNLGMMQSQQNTIGALLNRNSGDNENQEDLVKGDVDRFFSSVGGSRMTQGIAIILSLVAIAGFASGAINRLVTAFLSAFAVTFISIVLIARIPYLAPTRSSIHAPFMTVGIGAVVGLIIYFVYPHESQEVVYLSEEEWRRREGWNDSNLRLEESEEDKRTYTNEWDNNNNELYAFLDMYK